MRRMILSLFIGLGSAFVAWAASLAITESTNLATQRFDEHDIVIAIGVLLVAFGIILMRHVIEPLFAVLSGAAATAALWQVDKFPGTKSAAGVASPPEYWIAIAFTTFIFMCLVAVFFGGTAYRPRRSRS